MTKHVIPANRLRCVVYGTEDRINGFLLDQQMISQSPILAKFRAKMTRHTLEETADLGATVIPPEISVLNFDIHMRDWKSHYRELWLEFLNQALHFRLEWEIVWVGEQYPEIEWIHTPASKRLLFVSCPTVSDTRELGPAIPIKFL